MTLSSEIIGTQRRVRPSVGWLAPCTSLAFWGEVPLSSNETLSSITRRTISWFMGTGWSGPCTRSQATWERTSGDSSSVMRIAPRSAGMTSKIMARSCQGSAASSRNEPRAFEICSRVFRLRVTRADWGSAANEGASRLRISCGRNCRTFKLSGSGADIWTGLLGVLWSLSASKRKTEFPTAISSPDFSSRSLTGMPLTKVPKWL